jgi:hypothetical protein
MIYESSINENISLNNLKSFVVFLVLENFRLYKKYNKSATPLFQEFRAIKHEFLIFLIKYNEYIRTDMIHLCKYHN